MRRNELNRFIKKAVRVFAKELVSLDNDKEGRIQKAKDIVSNLASLPGVEDTNLDDWNSNATSFQGFAVLKVKEWASFETSARGPYVKRPKEFVIVPIKVSNAIKKIIKKDARLNFVEIPRKLAVTMTFMGKKERRFAGYSDNVVKFDFDLFDL